MTTAREPQHLGADPDLAASGLRRIDRSLLLLVGRVESGLLTRVTKTLTRMGDFEGWLLAGLLLAATGGDGLHAALLLATSSALATLASQVLKRLARRPRPAAALRGFVPRSQDPDEFSFPSGHTAAAFAVAVALSGGSPLLAGLTLALAAGIALSRIYLGAHYPLDVAAGVLLGAGAGCVARLLVEGWRLLPAVLLLAGAR